MSRIARNCAIDKLRSKGETMKAKSQNSEEIVSNISGNYSTENFTDAIGLKKVLSELPDKYLVIVELAYFKGYTMEECGTLLELPVGTVKTRMRMALCLLREKLSIN
jgi:RNA polymerase sigma-70 factor (ECF subfamily)